MKVTKVKDGRVIVGPVNCDKGEKCASYNDKCSTCKNNRAIPEKIDYYVSREE